MTETEIPPAPASARPPVRPPAITARRALVAALVLAAAFRVAHFVEIRDSPIPHLHRVSESDSAFYLEWARSIRGGNFLSAVDVRPYNSWHDRLARDVHRRSGAVNPFDESVGRRIWDRWLGDKALYADPLYPYFLAGLFAVTGEDTGWVWLVQSLFGLAIVGLIVVLAALLFDPVVALVAGLLAALYGPLVFHEPQILRSVFLSFGGLLAIVLVTLAIRKGGRRLWLASGVAIGVSILVQSTALVFMAAVGGLLLRRYRKAPRDLLGAAGGFALGLLLGISPLVGRNLAVGAPALQFAANGATTFILQNQADADADGGAQFGAGAAEILARTDGRFLPSVTATVATHPEFGDWLRLCGDKLLAFWRWYEIPNAANYAYWRLFARYSGALALSFGVIAPLGAVGLGLALWKRRGAAPAAAFVASGMLVAFFFLTLSRLRLPQALALVPFAAFTLVSVGRWLRAGRWRTALAATAAVALAGAVCWRPLPPGRTAIWAGDYRTGNEIAWHLARIDAASGNFGDASRRLERHLETEPESLRRLEPGESPSVIPLVESEVAGSFAQLHELAASLGEARRDRRAVEHHRYRAQVLRFVASRWDQAMRRIQSPTPEVSP